MFCSGIRTNRFLSMFFKAGLAELATRRGSPSPFPRAHGEIPPLPAPFLAYRIPKARRHPARSIPSC
jgi:hypothetical protein